MYTWTMEIQIASIVVAILIGIISKICYDWLRNNRENSHDIKIVKMCEEVEWLKEAHSKTDSDGLPVWYVPRELQKIAKENSERAFETNIILKEIKEILRESNVSMREVMREIQTLK